MPQSGGHIVCALLPIRFEWQESDKVAHIDEEQSEHTNEERSEYANKDCSERTGKERSEYVSRSVRNIRQRVINTYR